MPSHRRFSNRDLIAALSFVAFTVLLVSCGGSSSNSMMPPPPPPPASNTPFWAQWGSTAQHTGAANVAAQGLNKQLADIVYARPAGPYYITQLDTNLNVEWQFQNTTIDANHPNGYEWCVNAPAIDSNGVVYANSEDGNVYAIAQGNSGVSTTPKQKMFLKLALGAAYTPLSVGSDGKLYMQNDGHLLIVGN